MSDRPRILGLTAALFREKCSAERALRKIRDLAKAMNCRVELPEDMEMVLK